VFVAVPFQDILIPSYQDEALQYLIARLQIRYRYEA
jgi:hypothetical protein